MQRGLKGKSTPLSSGLVGACLNAKRIESQAGRGAEIPELRRLNAKRIESLVSPRGTPCLLRVSMQRGLKGKMGGPLYLGGRSLNAKRIERGAPVDAADALRKSDLSQCKED